jgi:hypothetical protein
MSLFFKNMLFIFLIFLGSNQVQGQTTPIDINPKKSRRLVSKEPTPFKASYEEGTCWVFVKVNAEGKVIKAKTVKASTTAPELHTTTVKNKKQWRVAKKIAKTYRYTPVESPKISTGHIAIVFISRKKR